MFVDRIGLGGGLALLWRSTVDITLRSFSRNHIDAMVEGAGDKPRWRLTGFYGELVSSNRHVTWNLLRLLATQSSDPWCCVGDFNEILGSHEKEGGSMQSSYQCFPGYFIGL